MSGYTYGGIIGDQPLENGNNNHASEYEFKGQWYHAYHNRVVAEYRTSRRTRCAWTPSGLREPNAN